jgi:K+-transporting ATPase ATPase C chain
MSSTGSNLAPTNHQLTDRVAADLDLVTTSASGIDPDIFPAAAQFQIPRVAKARKIPVSALQKLVDVHTTQRQFGILREPGVNVLELNRALDAG